MKKIVIVDGGPRKNMNTAQLLQRVAEGANGNREKKFRLFLCFFEIMRNFGVK